jgi:putative glutamine amidotransferase
MRPRIAIPGRYSQTASALRHGGLVIARRLVRAVYDAGGEPLVMHPVAPDGIADEQEVHARLDGVADGLLLPGGGDICPQFYGAGHHESLYRLDAEQDAFDLAAARWALAAGRPLLAICRGLQVVNVALGGTLIQDMPTHHRHVVSRLRLPPGTLGHDAVRQEDVRIACYHHQAIDALADGLLATARTDDGIIEAVELAGAGHGWFLGVQWHPEDTVATDPAQGRIFAALVAASGERRG